MICLGEYWGALLSWRASCLLLQRMGVVITFCCIFPVLTPMVFALFRAWRDAGKQIYFWHLWNQLPMVFYLRGMIVPTYCRKKDKQMHLSLCLFCASKENLFLLFCANIPRNWKVLNHMQIFRRVDKKQTAKAQSASYQPTSLLTSYS